MKPSEPKCLRPGDAVTVTVNDRQAILKRISRTTWTLTGQGFDAGHFAEDVNSFAETGEIPRSTQGRNW